MGIFGLSPFSKKKDDKEKKADGKQAEAKGQEMDKSQKKDAGTCEFC